MEDGSDAEIRDLAVYGLRLAARRPLVDVRVLDHFIVTAEDSISFSERGLL